MLSIEEIRRILEEYYGEIDDSGCYSGNGKWFSLEAIMELLEKNT